MAALLVAERRRPLRVRKEPGPARIGRNLAIGLLAGATTAASEWPVVAPVQALAERRRLGLIRRLGLPPALRVVVGFLLLDYTLYLWHRLVTRAFLRDFTPSTIDLDLDSTTGCGSISANALAALFGRRSPAARDRSRDVAPVAAAVGRLGGLSPQQPGTAR
jgi:hypothetical protein